MAGIRIGCALGSAFAGLTLCERLPTAFHEAGHSVVAIHLCETGINLNGWRGRLHDASPMLRFATVTPRKTDKGPTYIGETKLIVRWRDMHDHVNWARASVPDDGPLLSSSSAMDEPAARVGLARIAYLFGGFVAEERLAAALLPQRLLAHTVGDARAGCERLMDKPGTACGDLRKAQQVALLSVLPSPSGAAAATDKDAVNGEIGSAVTRQRVTPSFESAFGFTDDVLRVRWPLVCALSGALIVKGTVDGAQVAALSVAQRRASDTAAESSGITARLLALVAPFPFVFGCAFALGSEWPTRDVSRYGRPGEAWEASQHPPN